MKRRAKERLPRRLPGAFPTFLYNRLDELAGVWPEPEVRTDLVDRCHALRRKPLLILSDVEIEVALRQRIGLPWILQLAIIRLREDPLREGMTYGAGDMLRAALLLPQAAWGTYQPQLDEIADAVVPTLYDTGDPDCEPLVQAYRLWLAGR